MSFGSVNTNALVCFHYLIPMSTDAIAMLQKGLSDKSSSRCRASMCPGSSCRIESLGERIQKATDWGWTSNEYGESHSIPRVPAVLLNLLELRPLDHLEALSPLLRAPHLVFRGHGARVVLLVAPELVGDLLELSFCW
jgi:hypothetical protein